MGLSYYDAASLLFGREEFTASEFASRTGNPSAAKTLSELKRRGLVERVGRGRYRCLAPEERPDLRHALWTKVRNTLVTAPLPWAWTGSSAVEAWTGGTYRLSPSPVTRDFHIAVPADTLDEWRKFLRAHGIPYEGRKHIGAHVHLEPVTKLDEVEIVDGEPVIPREETLRLIHEHPALYEGAEETLLGG